MALQGHHTVPSAFVAATQQASWNIVHTVAQPPFLSCFIFLSNQHYSLQQQAKTTSAKRGQALTLNSHARTTQPGGAAALRIMHASNCPLQGPRPVSDQQRLGRERASHLDAQHQTRPQKLCLILPDKPLPLSSGLASSQPGLRGQRPAVANTSPPPDQTTTPKLPQEENTQPPFSHKRTFQAQRPPSRQLTQDTQCERQGMNTSVGSGQEGKEGASVKPVPAPHAQHIWDTQTSLQYGNTNK